MLELAESWSIAEPKGKVFSFIENIWMPKSKFGNSKNQQIRFCMGNFVQKRHNFHKDQSHIFGVFHLIGSSTAIQIITHSSLG